MHLTLRTFLISPTITPRNIKHLVNNLNHLFFGPSLPITKSESPLAFRAIASLSNLVNRFENVREATNTTANSTITTPSLGTDTFATLPNLCTYQTFNPIPNIRNVPIPIITPPSATTPKKGQPTVINAARISLPDTTPYRMPPSKLLDLLPLSVRNTLHENADEEFFQPMRNVINVAQTGRRIPDALKHTVSTIRGHYPLTLAKCHQAGMLAWEATNTETKEETILREYSTLSSFAIVKSSTKDRLISWPKLQNEVGPTPPNPDLPKPDAWSAISDSATSLAGFHFDIRDMFHHLPLPTKLERLFPLQSVLFRDLPPALQEALRELPHLVCIPSARLRPFQTSLPMGWTWAVVIAQAVSSSLLQIGTALYAEPNQLPKVHRLNGDIHTIKDGDALIDSYIDDAIAICANWAPEDIAKLQLSLQTVFEEHGLPFHPEKSSPRGVIIKDKITFTGWTWSLTEKVVFPHPDKIYRVQQSVRELVHTNATTREVLAIVGKLIWFALAKRPLLSILQDTFALNDQLLDHFAKMTPSMERELHTLASLLPLSFVDMGAEWTNMIIATDASETAGAVVYGTIDPTIARNLFATFLRASSNGNTAPTIHSEEGRAYIALLEHVTTTVQWITAFTHRWTRREHISGLEASILALSSQWAASRGLSHRNTVWLTESACVLGAFKKGRSSIPHMLTRCRKVAATTLAHGLIPRYCFVPSHLNPADEPSRPDR